MKITHLALDVDGTLTDGGIFINSEGVETKKFQAKDGLIIRVLPEIGIKTIILTGRASRLTQIRADDLHISYVLQGVVDKFTVLDDFLRERGEVFEQTAYIGDDLNDYAAMKRCGFKACPADAAAEIKAIADYIAPHPGVDGAVRDVCEELLRLSGLRDAFLRLFKAGNMVESRCTITTEVTYAEPTPCLCKADYRFLCQPNLWPSSRMVMAGLCAITSAKLMSCR
jgi:3-deoxy-D-manno-octulosonate 8-phosphate phosphatase (KDO 8-P phosphatase)